MNVIRELGKMGRTVLVSSHILSEIERITEQIIILHHGKLVALGNLHAIRERLDQIPHTIRLVGTDARALAKDILVRILNSASNPIKIQSIPTEKNIDDINGSGVCINDL